jgi:hypothetical protein
LGWLQKRELQWRKRSAVAREAIRRKEAEAAEAKEAERKFNLFLAKRRAEQLSDESSEDEESSDESSDDSSDDNTVKSVGQSTILDGIIELACRWSAGIRRSVTYPN